MKKYLKQHLAKSSLISVWLMFLISTVVLAVPSNISYFIVRPTSSTSIYMVWTNATASTSTLVRYSTTTYPATTADGTLAYSGTASYADVTGLTPGTTYYFSAWGYDGALYSVTAAHAMTNTSPINSTNTTIPYLTPQMPAKVHQTPSSGTWSWSPFDKILTWFVDPTATHGGLGMPVDNFINWMVSLLLAGIATWTYIKWRNFFSSWFALFFMTLCGVWMGIIQGLVIVIELAVGLGVWAVEHSFQ